MLIIGLTGSIGMGKSAAASRFRANGIAVFDADVAVHDLYSGAAAGPVEASFPGTAVHGKVDRNRLSAALLNEPQKFKLLEQIVHPLVRAAERAFIQEQAAKGAPVAVLEIPLLFEAGGYERVDVIVVVSSSSDVQRARVLARPGMTAEKFDRLLKRQLPDEEKRKRADFIVDTNGSVDACNDQIDAIVKTLRSRQGSVYERFWRASPQ
jgi:dephospho-CoA kinase